MDASKDLVLISKGFWNKWAEKVYFELGPRFKWTWKQDKRELDDDVGYVSIVTPLPIEGNEGKNLIGIDTMGFGLILHCYSFRFKLL